MQWENLIALKCGMKDMWKASVEWPSTPCVKTVGRIQNSQLQSKSFPEAPVYWAAVTTYLDLHNVRLLQILHVRSRPLSPQLWLPCFNFCFLKSIIIYSIALPWILEAVIDSAYAPIATLLILGSLQIQLFLSQHHCYCFTLGLHDFLQSVWS